MRLRTGVVLVVMLMIAALAALNWGTLAAPTQMSLGVTQTTAPLGLVMLALTAVLGVVCLAYVLYLQSTVLLEARRHNKELQAQRDLADKAEASRFTELRSYLDAQDQTRVARNAQLQDRLLARIDQLEVALKSRTDQSDNSTAAHIGQLEDRLERRNTLTGANPQL